MDNGNNSKKNQTWFAVHIVGIEFQFNNDRNVYFRQKTKSSDVTIEFEPQTGSALLTTDSDGKINKFTFFKKLSGETSKGGNYSTDLAGFSLGSGKVKWQINGEERPKSAFLSDGLTIPHKVAEDGPNRSRTGVPAGEKGAQYWKVINAEEDLEWFARWSGPDGADSLYKLESAGEQPCKALQ